MRLFALAFLTMMTATTALAQPTGSLMHEMTNIGKQKDNDGQKLPQLEKKKEDALFTVVGSGVNTQDEISGQVTVLDDGGPASKPPVAEKAPAKPAAKVEAKTAIKSEVKPLTTGGEPESDLWTDMTSFFESLVSEEPAKSAPAN